MARGQVVFVSRNGGMVVVGHDDGFTVVELIGDEGELQRGDVVFGDWHALGGEPIKKSGENHAFDAYFQGLWSDLASAVTIARNTGGG
jgi:hypothetical protein